LNSVDMILQRQHKEIDEWCKRLGSDKTVIKETLGKFWKKISGRQYSSTRTQYWNIKDLWIMERHQISSERREKERARLWNKQVKKGGHADNKLCASMISIEE